MIHGGMEVVRRPRQTENEKEKRYIKVVVDKKKVQSYWRECS